MIRKFWALAVALTAVPAAYPWGAQGHAAIGIIAEQNLSAATRRQVEALLGNDDLGAIASWMDDLRGATNGYGRLAADTDARAFAQAHPHNDQWHYVDLPLGEKVYTDDDPFARPDDVVHEINHAVAVLEGRQSDVSKKIALYMLVHFVGDLHQPLHVSCGYYDLSDLAHPQLIRDPAAAKGHLDDKGANALSFGPGRYDELHGYWDTALPRKVDNDKRDSPSLATKLMQTHRAAEAATSGDYHQWPEQWAGESIAAARQIYAGLTFGAAELDAKQTLHKIAIQLPAGADEQWVPLAEKRLAEAGYRLAALLNALQWAD